jgi:hypothetical protein
MILLSFLNVCSLLSIDSQGSERSARQTGGSHAQKSTSRKSLGARIVIFWVTHASSPFLDLRQTRSQSPVHGKFPGADVLFSGVLARRTTSKSNGRTNLEVRRNSRKCWEKKDVDGAGQTVCQDGCRTHETIFK